MVCSGIKGPCLHPTREVHRFFRENRLTSKRKQTSPDVLPIAMLDQAHGYFGGSESLALSHFMQIGLNAYFSHSKGFINSSLPRPGTRILIRIERKAARDKTCNCCCGHVLVGALGESTLLVSWHFYASCPTLQFGL